MSEQTTLFDDVDADDILRHIDDDVVKDNDSWPQSLVEMIEVFTQHLEESHACDATDAGKMARGLVASLAKHFGGMQFYLPIGWTLQKAIRDNEIWLKFDGHNHNALSKEYQLTVVQIYSIIKRQRALSRNKRQTELFPEASN
jgi:Mor family transcriptional regulator